MGTAWGRLPGADAAAQAGRGGINVCCICGFVHTYSSPCSRYRTAGRFTGLQAAAAATAGAGWYGACSTAAWRRRPPLVEGPGLKLARLLKPARSVLWPRHPRTRPTRLRHLPLVEERAPRPGRTLAFVFTGDGNWAILVRALARELAWHGVGSVGLKARTYLLRRRPPHVVARHVERVLRHYLEAWGQDRLVLVGLSRGADLLPFVVRRLPADLRERIDLLALFSPARTTNFRFRWADLFGPHEHPGDVPLLPELQAIEGIPILCVNGTADEAALGPSLPPGLVECVMVDGGHNLNRDYRLATRLILDRLVNQAG